MIPFLYAHILIVVRRASRRVADTNFKRTNKNNKSNRTALVLFILDLAFVVAYSPYFIFSLMAASVEMSREGLKVWVLFMWGIVASVSAYNPILYVTLFTQFRDVFCKMFKCKNGRTEVTQFTTTEN